MPALHRASILRRCSSWELQITVQESCPAAGAWSAFGADSGRSHDHDRTTGPIPIFASAPMRFELIRRARRNYCRRSRAATSSAGVLRRQECRIETECSRIGGNLISVDLIHQNYDVRTQFLEGIRRDDLMPRTWYKAAGLSRIDVDHVRD
jgi:hypothetical protein